MKTVQHYYLIFPRFLFSKLYSDRVVMIFWRKTIKLKQKTAFGKILVSHSSLGVALLKIQSAHMLKESFVHVIMRYSLRKFWKLCLWVNLMLFAMDIFFGCIMLYNLCVSSYFVYFISHPVCPEIYFNVQGLFLVGRREPLT